MAKSFTNRYPFTVPHQLGFVIVIITVLTFGGTAVVARSYEAAPINDDSPTSLYKECTSNFDCPTNYCCTVGMMRYTVPFCSLMGIKDDPCRPENDRHNLTLSFPTFKLNIVESYLLLCPCKEGLQCNRDTGSCSSRLNLPRINKNIEETPFI